MTDADLVQSVYSFREGILDGRPADLMCAAVCFPLVGFLNFMGVDCDYAMRDIPDDGYPANHFWIRLSDGRVLDPTADQFSALHLPPVYLGEPLSPIHRPAHEKEAGDE